LDAHYDSTIVAERTQAELADRAGVSVDYITTLVELGVLNAGDTSSPFVPGDIRRVRFVHGLEQGGVPLEAIATAIKDGHLSFAFFDHSYWERFGGLVPKTFRELSAETGVDLELLQVLRESIGYARPGPDERVRQDELDCVELVKMGIAAGADPAAMERQVRVWGENVRRIAEADSNFYHTQIEVPLLKSGMSEAEVLQVGSDAAASMANLLDQALVSMYRAQSEHTWMAVTVEAVEATLEKAGLHRTVSQPPAMCFLDLSGYTHLTEERGDEAAAEMAATLGQLVQRSSHQHGGRAVKWLGDGVMIYFENPGAAPTSALEMVASIPDAGLPPAHVGIDAGPVIFQDGDYFGRTVNTAARIAATAGAGQVLVSDRAMQSTTDPGVSFREIGPTELKGLPRPILLHQASRSA
jgi:adenylate cyclase